MAAPMLSTRAVQTIRRLQRLNWEASRAIASPTVDLVLERPGVGTLAAQAVVVIWNRGGGHVAAAGDDTPAADVTFRRLLSDGFDVETGDRFVLDGNRGVVTRVKRLKGLIRAEARWVTGVVWP